MKKLFPQYLNQGSNGYAVLFLQRCLSASSFGRGVGLDVDGEYGPVTATCVKVLQEFLGCEADGNFGPATRKALKDRLGLDTDAVLAVPGEITWWIGGPDNKTGQIW
jgi:peptidoglycan hydrolase-like protein with peptidoglycan-binding domain